MLAINFIYVIAIMFSIYVYIVSINNHSSKISDIFILFMLVQMVINISAIVLLPIESATIIEWFIAYKVRNVALAFLPIIWLMFLHEYLDVEYNKGIIAFFSLISLIEFVFVVTKSFKSFAMTFFRNLQINSFADFIESYTPMNTLFGFLTVIAMMYAFALYYKAVKNRQVTLRWEIVLITVLIQLMVIFELFVSKQFLQNVDITIIYSLFATLSFYRLVISNEIKSVIPISNGKILDNLPTPIMILDPENIIVYANNKALLEINSLEVGKKMSNIAGFVSVNTDDQIFNSNSITIKRNDGEIYTYVIHNEFYDGYAIIKLSNATEEKKKIEALNVLSSYDTLTNILNKTTFFTEAKEKISNTNNFENYKLNAVFMMDIDFFKQINDTYGHQAGDFVLSTLGHHLQEFTNELEGDNLIARFGGEEFCGYIQTNSKEAILMFLENFRMHYSKIEFKSEDIIYKSTLSIGVTFFNDSNKTLETLIEEADIALYNAKKAGRNKLVVFSDK